MGVITINSHIFQNLLNDYSIVFDGVDEYLQLASTIQINYNTAFSVSFWIKVNSSASGEGTIFSSNNLTYNASIRFSTTNNKIIFYHVNSGIEFQQASSPVNSCSKNVWHHIVVGRTGTAATGVSMWIDGVPQSMTVDTDTLGTLNVTYDRTFIGNRTNDNYYKGHLDEVVYYNRKLTDTEALEIYNTGTPLNMFNFSSQSSLVHWYRMGDGDTYSTIVDNIGANDATMTNQESGDIVTDTP